MCIKHAGSDFQPGSTELMICLILLKNLHASAWLKYALDSARKIQKSSTHTNNVTFGLLKSSYLTQNTATRTIRNWEIRIQEFMPESDLWTHTLRQVLCAAGSAVNTNSNRKWQYDEWKQGCGLFLGGLRRCCMRTKHRIGIWHDLHPAVSDDHRWRTETQFDSGRSGLGNDRFRRITVLDYRWIDSPCMSETGIINPDARISRLRKGAGWP